MTEENYDILKVVGALIFLLGLIGFCLFFILLVLAGLEYLVSLFGYGIILFIFGLACMGIGSLVFSKGEQRERRKHDDNKVKKTPKEQG